MGHGFQVKPSTREDAALRYVPWHWGGGLLVYNLIILGLPKDVHIKVDTYVKYIKQKDSKI